MRHGAGGWTPWDEKAGLELESDVFVLVVDDTAVYTGVNFVRNSPLLTNEPKIMLLGSLDDAQLAVLCRNYHTIIVDHTYLARFGLPIIPPEMRPELEEFEPWPRRRDRAGCP